MNQAELLQKALETADLIAGGGLLNPEQSDKFITYLHDLSVMAKDARQIPMKAKKREVNKIGIGQRASVPAAEGQDPAVRQKPSFSKVELDTVEIMTPFEITTSKLASGNGSCSASLSTNSTFATFISAAAARAFVNISGVMSIPVT